jgi:hypothetical protein
MFADAAGLGNRGQGVDKLYLLNAVTPDELTQGKRSAIPSALISES